jgi:hypothetical protein
MAAETEVIVRRSVRHDVVMRAAISIAPEHARHVKFGAAAGAREGWVDGDVVDFSAGGLGFVSGLFVPRKARIGVRVFSPVNPEDVLLTCIVRVQRVTMTDRRPAYLLGTSFENPPPEVGVQINDLLAILSGERQLPGRPEPAPTG